MRPELVVYKFLRQAIDGKPITIAGQGQQTRCFIHINDLVEGIIQAAITPSAAGKTYNLPGPRPISIRELAELVTELVPNSPEIIFVPGRQNESRGQAISRSRAENELGWQPRVDVRDGVRELYAWLNSTTNGSGKAFRQSI
jgi:nucleoside-diphosphate-sugar epimerase